MGRVPANRPAERSPPPPDPRRPPRRGYERANMKLVFKGKVLAEDGLTLTQAPGPGPAPPPPPPLFWFVAGGGG